MRRIGNIVSVALIINFLLVITNYCSAQNPAARYEIDAKRAGVSPFDKDAIPRSREFIRLDSTYYVGWMFEGLYKFEKSSDYFGYRNAIVPLRKALFLLEKDYSRTLKSLFNSSVVVQQPDFTAYYKYYDMLGMCQALKESYENIEMPDSVIWVIDRVESYKFPEDRLHFKTAKAWTYHRNRFFTSAKYKFLKNSIEENEKTALYYCYQAMAPQVDNSLFGSTADNLYAWHNLAIIHNYLKNYDSSEYYYRQLIQSGAVSYNNYGLLQHELGNFEDAKRYISMNLGSHNRMLEEGMYFIPILEVYSGRVKQAISLTKTQITRAGSTPGFGWYNLSLARSYLYDGQLDSSQYALDKAAGFKELHIGTTLTQTQYDFTINLLKLQLIEKKIAREKFTNDGWWYSPSSLYNIASYRLDKFLLQYVLVNQMINNPERDRLVYDLFCNESTTTFDEAFSLIKSFSLPYFIKMYDQYPKKDSRLNIRRYFKLYEAKLNWEDGNENTATKQFEELLQQTMLDTASEKLFLARLYEGLSKCYDDNGDKQKFLQYSNALFEEYPTIVPYSGITMRMKLNYSGLNDGVTDDVIDDLKDCDIKWRDQAGIPTVDIVFSKKDNRYEALMTVRSASGKVIVSNQRLVFKKDDDDVGKELGLRIFGKGGGVTFE
jgi:hypothetical protein